TARPVLVDIVRAEVAALLHVVDFRRRRESGNAHGRATVRPAQDLACPTAFNAPSGRKNEFQTFPNVSGPPRRPFAATVGARHDTPPPHSHRRNQPATRQVQCPPGRWPQSPILQPPTPPRRRPRAPGPGYPPRNTDHAAAPGIANY